MLLMLENSKSWNPFNPLNNYIARESAWWMQKCGFMCTYFPEKIAVIAFNK